MAEKPEKKDKKDKATAASEAPVAAVPVEKKNTPPRPKTPQLAKKNKSRRRVFLLDWQKTGVGRALHGVPIAPCATYCRRIRPFRSCSRRIRPAVRCLRHWREHKPQSAAFYLRGWQRDRAASRGGFHAGFPDAPISAP